MISYGKVTVTTPGTKVMLTSNLSQPSAPAKISALMVQVLPTNTGKIYIVRENWNSGTYEGIIAILPPPTANTFPTFSNSHRIAIIDPSNFYIDADNGGEGIIACGEPG